LPRRADARKSAVSGKLVRLRPLRRDDHRISVAWRNDPAVRDYIMGYRFPVTAEMEADWVERVLKDQGRTRLVLAIEDLRDGALVGFVYLSDIDWISRTAEFGILIGDKSRQGRGFGHEALELIVAHAFGVMGLERIFLRVAAYNRPAIQLYRRFGFVDEGRMRRHVLLANRRHDVLLMGLLRSEFTRTVGRASIRN
jgi:diamine N-acetyltransferase